MEDRKEIFRDETNDLFSCLMKEWHTASCILAFEKGKECLGYQIAWKNDRMGKKGGSSWQVKWHIPAFVCRI